MNKKLRSIPFPAGSSQRQWYIRQLMDWFGKTYHEARAIVSLANHLARNTPGKDEKCEALTRKGTACMCKALANGRCKYHGGLSTGPITAKGKRKVATNLRSQ